MMMNNPNHVSQEEEVVCGFSHTHDISEGTPHRHCYLQSEKIYWALAVAGRHVKQSHIYLAIQAAEVLAVGYLLQHDCGGHKVEQ